MSKVQIYEEIKETFGLVPTFFKAIPEASLELEWQLFKTLQLEESPIPNKYRELIGIAIAATSKCQYCTFFHTEIAKLYGATDEEIEDAVHFAKASAGWSAYLNGLQFDLSEFKDEVRQIGKYIQENTAVTA